MSDFLRNNDLIDLVTYAGYTVKAGQSIAANDTFVTKGEAYTLLNINLITGTQTDYVAPSDLVRSYNSINTTYSTVNRWWAQAFSYLEEATRYTIWCANPQFSSTDGADIGDTMCIDNTGALGVADGYYFQGNSVHTYTYRVESNIITEKYSSLITVLTLQANTSSAASVEATTDAGDLKYIGVGAGAIDTYLDEPISRTIIAFSELGGWVSSPVWFDDDSGWLRKPTSVYHYFSIVTVGSSFVDLIIDPYNVPVSDSTPITLNLTIDNVTYEDSAPYEDNSPQWPTYWAVDRVITFDCTKAVLISDTLHVNFYVEQDSMYSLISEDGECTIEIDNLSSSNSTYTITTRELFLIDIETGPLVVLSGATYAGWEQILL